MPRVRKSDKLVADIFSDKKNPVCVRNVTRSGKLYFITRGLHGGNFKLFYKSDAGYELLAEASSPIDFSDMIPWDR